MADLPAAAGWPDWARGLTTVDLVLLAGLALYVLDGIRRGFIAGALGLLGVVAAFAVAFRFYRPAAELIGRQVTLPELVANVAGFFAVLIVAQLALGLLIRLALGALAPVRRLLGPLNALDHVAGAIPGLVQGVVLAALVLTPLRLFPVYKPLAETIERSPLAGEITRRAAALLPQAESLLGQAVGQGLFFRAPVVAPDQPVQLPARTDLRPDPAAEARMLELVNAERATAGLRPLVADEGIREVARQHSEEMFRLGYFAHDSPQGGSPADRLRQRGIPFKTVGENLAYAPTVEVAHAGLMTSPGHRRNILAPEYTRVGIGVVSAGLYGRMFTQDFAD